MSRNTVSGVVCSTGTLFLAHCFLEWPCSGICFNMHKICSSKLYQRCDGEHGTRRDGRTSVIKNWKFIETYMGNMLSYDNQKCATPFHKKHKRYCYESKFETSQSWMVTDGVLTHVSLFLWIQCASLNSNMKQLAQIFVLTARFAVGFRLRY